MKKSFIILCLCLGIATVGQAQKYRTAGGLRFDSEQIGLTLQQKLHEGGTLEVIGSLRSREYSGTALYERHYPLLGKRLNYYLGAGAHIGNLKDHGVFAGGDLIGGIEYKVNGLPILLSADIKPAFHVNHEDWVDLSTGISVRYVFIKEKQPERKKWWPFGNREEENNRNKKKAKEEESGGFFKIFRKD
ncbi:hypothetical protein [Pontibacter harenae]|uniref:hypothetical protein n=1 Tax=Pontibacter harenae TaxID=2894083 RepID=UPI001E4C4AB9|nr:hypothetical protein [Pontibacter harenae]MCC9167324.1 hypothetical protein [Pontibacter harenae]